MPNSQSNSNIPHINPSPKSERDFFMGGVDPAPFMDKIILHHLVIKYSFGKYYTYFYNNLGYLREAQSAKGAGLTNLGKYYTMPA